MLRRLLEKLLSRPRRAAEVLPSVLRGEVSHLFVRDHGMPHVDWGMARAWVDGREAQEGGRAALRRAIAAAWLDELRDAAETDSRRWRRGIVEGLAPLEGTAAARLADSAERSIEEIGRALAPIRGVGPISPIAVVGLGTHEEYYSFVSHFYEEGNFATSGGLYLRSDGDSFPVLVVAAQVKTGLEYTVAHELTHHALCASGLPLWAEEGLTQMMEERVVGSTHFAITREMVERHRALWLEDGFGALMDGSGFSSPDGETQELSYHMAQVLVRGLLETRPKSFFAFARACAGTPWEFAAREHLGAAPEAIAEGMLRTRGLG